MATKANSTELLLLRCNASLVSRELISDLHENETEKVQAAPLVRIARMWVVGLEPNAPDSIDRAGLNEDPLGGALEKAGEPGILQKLFAITSNRDPESMLNPDFLDEATHFTTDRLRCTWRTGCQDPLLGVAVREETGRSPSPPS